LKLTDGQKQQFLAVFFKAFDLQIEQTFEDLDENNQSQFEVHKTVLELLIFCWFWLFSLESKKDKKQIMKFFELVQKFVSLNLNALFMSTSELDLIINDVVLKSIRMALDQPETVKNQKITALITDIAVQCLVKTPSCSPGIIN
jgi:hypothetical protein